MKKFFAVIALSGLILSGNGCVAETDEQKAPPQIGFNFIRSFDNGDFANLNAGAIRQLTDADVLWQNVEPQNDAWDFSGPDAVLKDHSGPEPIVTLFALQYASPNPPWMTRNMPFEKSMTDDARDYVTTVVDRYKDDVTYWEIGNEMDHWRAADPGAANIGRNNGDKLPPSLPEDGFSPEEQGAFMKDVADLIRAHDPDAVIVLPGMGGLSDYHFSVWLPGVIKGGGDFFDVVNYHYYTSWEGYTIARGKFTETLEKLDIGDKPVWNTETGSTASATLTERTNYPNSPESQAADIFRRIIPAYAMGDDLVLWHTYFSSPEGTANNWRGYGVISDKNQKMPSYYAFKLLTENVLPFASVEKIEANARGKNVYKITHEDGVTLYVAWGSGTWTVPDGMTSMTAVVSESGEYAWEPTKATVILSPTPILLK